jgi:SAM-dependent methyltransferase
LLAGAYKHLLGRLLGWGLRVNLFAFPEGYSPVPSPARRYIGQFLERYAGAIRGRCVEFAPPYYRALYGGRAEVTRYDVWDIEPRDGVSVVADLEAATRLADGSFDTIICTHVLCNVGRPWRAVAELHRLLAPGGVVLCTVPMVLQGHAPHPKDFWRFTTDALSLLFGEHFGRVETHYYGNAATASGSMQYLMTRHFNQGVLDLHDPRCPSVVACAAWK